MKPSNKLITALLLSSGAAAGIAAINKYIKVSAVSKNLLQQPNPHCYRWRFGNIYYTKEGTGKPLLLLHDLNYFSSGCEWESLIPTLKKHYTVYTVDLLGCGRSEKPNLTYTNFLYVQLLSDFIQSEIVRRTSVIATGASAPLVIMTCGYRSDLFDQLLFINPESFASCSQIPGKYSKLYKWILDAPILGTLLYHFASTKKNLEQLFQTEYFYNPYSVKPSWIEKYYESAHLGDFPKAVYSSIQCNYTKCSISRTLEQINNSIYILTGEEKANAQGIVKEYLECNPAIESGTIPKTRHLPQLEKPEEVCRIIDMFFG